MLYFLILQALLQESLPPVNALALAYAPPSLMAKSTHALVLATSHSFPKPALNQSCLSTSIMSQFNSRNRHRNFLNLNAISEYYDEKIKFFGPTPSGVDWKDHASQYIRLQKITEILPKSEEFSINDLGCGYGEMAIYLREAGYGFHYFGYDMSEKMISEAGNYLSSLANVTLIKNSTLEIECDFSVASGIFNVKCENEIQIWQKHIYDTLNMMYEKSTRGFSFNILSSYLDAVKQKNYIYYGNPNDYLQYCLKKFSRNVRLDHSYGLYEFTVHVLKRKK